MNVIGRPKTVGQLAAHGYQEPVKSTKTLARSLVNMIFGELDKRYPYKWKGQFNGDESFLSATKILWGSELAHIEERYVMQAIGMCSDKFLEWPPTVGQFKHLCESLKTPQRLRESKEVLNSPAPPPSKDPSKIAAIGLINLGAEVCKKLKVIYPNRDWYFIGNIFTEIKKKLRPVLDCNSELKFLETLATFSVDEFREVIHG